MDPSIKRSEWTEEEIEKFKVLNKSYPGKWTKISMLMPGRTRIDVRHKSQELESNGNPKAKKQKKHHWIKEEDVLLLESVQKLGLKKMSIIKQKHFQYLSLYQLKERYNKLTSESNISIKEDSKKRIDRPEPEPKRRRINSQPQPQTPLDFKVQGLISDFLRDFEKLTNSSEYNND